MHRAERKTPDQEQRFLAIVEHATDLILLYDLELRCLYTNPAAERVLGADMLSDRHGPTQMHADLRKRFEECFHRVVETGNEQVIEIRLSGPQTERAERDYQFRLIPEKDAVTGDVQAVLGMGRDISDMKNLERELRKAIAVKSEFLATMSHEIRTPLAGILGIAEMALKRETPPDLHEDLRMISDSAGSLNRIINDILDFSKIEAGRIELLSVGFELDSLLDNVMKTFKLSAQSKAIGLFVEVGKEVPKTLVGDPHRLKQILSNLVSNAIKFTDRGFVRVGVSADEVKSGKVMLRLSVQDTGSGIPKAKLNKLFQSFVQLDLSSPRRRGGTGLGLIISRQLARLMGGNLEVRSRAGHGSTFTTTVLLDIGARPAEKDRPVCTVGQLHPVLKILLAEDNPVNVAFLKRYLTSSGYQVNCAPNGLEAVQALTRDQYDLVLMDIQMPELDGVEATRRIRSGTLPRVDPHIPIIALTAYAMKGDRERFLEAGMNGYVSKPVDFKELTRVIGELAGVEGAGADLRQREVEMM
jgi:PAS domain S-box-containing protein